jgi:hypothetical protein
LALKSTLAQLQGCSAQHPCARIWLTVQFSKEYFLIFDEMNPGESAGSRGYYRFGCSVFFFVGVRVRIFIELVIVVRSGSVFRFVAALLGSLLSLQQLFWAASVSLQQPFFAASLLGRLCAKFASAAAFQINLVPNLLLQRPFCAPSCFYPISNLHLQRPFWAALLAELFWC